MAFLPANASMVGGPLDGRWVVLDPYVVESARYDPRADGWRGVYLKESGSVVWQWTGSKTPVIQSQA